MGRQIRIHGYMDSGYEGQSILIECSIRNGFPGFDIVGLPGNSVKEARERVRCALRSCNFKFPQSRILVNLSPASTPKNSTLLDLPLACSILYRQSRQPTHAGKTDMEDIDQFLLTPEESPCNSPVDIMVVGELSLDGHVVEAPQAMGAIEAARRIGCKACILPFRPMSNGLDDGMLLIQAVSLPQAFASCMDISKGNIRLPQGESVEDRGRVIFQDIIGMEKEKDILAMAASGFHSTLLFGPPGVGKTMLSCRVHMLLPELTKAQRSEVSRILGCANIHDSSSIRPERMRILSHDCTQTQFVSGKSPKSPGEGALSHLCTLVLDEVNKYSPKLLETVKDSYDKGYTQSSRSGEVIAYPSRFLMVGNLNPCPCGGLGDPQAICTCTAQKITNHWNRVGRQLVERFDIRIPVSGSNGMLSEISSPNRDDAHYTDNVRLSTARQNARYRDIEGVDLNGQVHFSTAALLTLRKEIELFNRISNGRNQSSRSQIGCITLARTIADYEDRPDVTEEDFAKAMELRRYGIGDYYWRSLR